MSEATNTLKKPSLAVTHPEIAKQWHPNKNNVLKPEMVTRSYKKEIVWICDKGHEWLEKVSSRTRQKTALCVHCNSFGFKYPELAKELDATASDIDPFTITAGTPRKAQWNCSVCHKKYIATINNRVRNGSGCPHCSKRVVAYENSIAFTHPELAKQFNKGKNSRHTIDSISQHYRDDVHWICEEGHEWTEPVSNRTKRKEANCKICCSLGYRNKSLAAEWHPDNTESSHEISANSNEKIKWLCSSCGYIWFASAANRFRGSGCPGCATGWSVEKIRSFIASLLPFLDSLSDAALYAILQQKGLLDMDKYSQGKPFIKVFKTGNFPKEELEKFVENKPSLVDKFIINHEEFVDDNQNELLSEITEETLYKEDLKLRIVKTKDVLARISNIQKFSASLDAETVDFLIKESVADIWNHTFASEDEAQSQLKRFQGSGDYAEEVLRLFTKEYEGAKNLVIPQGYSFPDGPPNLMQCYTAYLVQTRKRIGNWSGTGAGKTNAAILASKIINANLTIICCPNNVIAGWKKDIVVMYPHSIVYTKENISRIKPFSKKHQYLLLNYEFFQQPNAGAILTKLLDNCQVNFVVIDEIHFSKQRSPEKASERKRLIATFLSEAFRKNESLHVLGMSATPVINNLYEGKTLIELVTGLYHDDLETKPTVSNCINLYKKFVSHGIRYKPQYKQQLNEKKIDVDCAEWLPEIKAAKSHVALEAILTKAKLPFILEQLQPHTVVYTHYRDNIETFLQEAITKKGWRVGLFNGDVKDGLEDFKNGNIDVLIASSCLGTGVDGLQKVCNRLIINCLPWTRAEYEQLIGRLYRQGQVSSHVDVIIPLTNAVVNGERWSWCESRWKRIEFKKSIADAAVDGIIPEGHLRTPAQAYKDVMQWLNRLDNNGDQKIERQRIELSLSSEQQLPALRKVGDLSQMNHKINRVSSTETHQRFINNPSAWHEYHETYRETRKDWQVIPYQEAIKWCQARPHMVIGDFGCGEAFLAQELPNKVYSFDHITINDKVIACDMAHVPLQDAVLEAAIFSLSLMGTNWVAYLREAHRCLKLDGHLWIAEPTARLSDIKAFKELLERLGFDIRSCDAKGKFTFVTAIKSERTINDSMMKTLLEKSILH